MRQAGFPGAYYHAMDGSKISQGAWDRNDFPSKYRVTSPGTITVSSSEFVEARKAREAKHAEYERLAKESALKRKMLAQEMDRRYYQSKAISIAAYEAAGILK